MTNIYPVLLAGGSGTRLWPLSRKSYPKQFSSLLGDKSLFQLAAMRVRSSNEIEFRAPITVTNNDFRFIVAEQLQFVGIDPGSILIEPEAKNTAPAILAASLFAFARDPNSVLLACPADHLIDSDFDFHAAIKIGLKSASRGEIVTFGPMPSRPETGYGYLELSDVTPNSDGVCRVLRFHEKPTRERAVQMISTGNCLWNAGIFLFRAKDMISAFKKIAPETLSLASDAVNNSKADLGFLRLDPEPWASLESKSIDYCIMEKLQNLFVVPYSSRWTDLGGWEAVWSESDKDLNGNVVSKGAFLIDCEDSLIRTETPSQKIVGLGLDSIIAISMSDAVLVANKNRSQEVGKVVDLLKSYDVKQATTYPKDHRPWGWFESLVMDKKFQVKRIFVNPGQALSLQSHRHRSEHWIVVQGTARVAINNKVELVEEGSSTFVPLGAKHRLENPGIAPMVLIEIQIGDYLGEDDIVRYEDVYDRQ